MAADGRELAISGINDQRSARLANPRRLLIGRRAIEGTEAEVAVEAARVPRRSIRRRKGRVYGNMPGLKKKSE